MSNTITEPVSVLPSWEKPYTVKNERKRIWFKWFYRHHIMYDETSIFWVDADEDLAHVFCEKMNVAYNVGIIDCLTRIKIENELKK